MVLRRGRLVCFAVPIVKHRARPAEHPPLLRLLLLSLRWRVAVARAIALDTALTIAAARTERSPRTTEAIERALAPGDVPDAADDQQTPRKIGATAIVADVAGLPGLDQGIGITILIRIVDQPEPTENEEDDEDPSFPIAMTVVHSCAPFVACGGVLPCAIPAICLSR